MKKKIIGIVVFTLLISVCFGNLCSAISLTNKEIKEDPEEYKLNINDNLERPWGWYNDGIDVDWAGLGIAEARADSDSMDGNMFAATTIAFFGKNVAEAWFYHGEEKFRLPDGYLAGEYDISFDYYYRGKAKGIEFASGGDAYVSVALELAFGSRTRLIILYERDSFGQTWGEFPFSDSSTYKIEDVYLEPGNYYNFYAKLLIYTKSEVWTFTSDVGCNLQIFEGYLKKVVIPGGYGGDIGVSLNLLDFGTMRQNEAVKTKTFDVINHDSVKPLQWQVDESIDYGRFEINPKSGIIQPSGRQTIEVTADPRNFPVTNYGRNVAVENVYDLNDHASVQLKVSITKEKIFFRDFKFLRNTNILLLFRDIIQKI